MRIGFSLGSLLSIHEILDCSKILSRYKIDSIWIPETWGMECCSMISAISQVANKSKIGSSIINIYSRSPALVAMASVTLDTLSNGRFILGLGTSSQTIVDNWHGMKFDKPVKRMREYIEIIKGIVSGSKFNYEGELFHIKNFKLLIKPHRNQIPIYIAAINQKMVELTWEIADGAIFYLRPMEELRDTIQKMQDIRKIDVACQLITCVSEDEEKAMQRAKKTIAFYVSVGRFYRDFLSRNGFEEDTKAIFEEYKKSGFNQNYKMVSDKMVNSLAICGTAEMARKKLLQFTRAGIDLPILQFNPIGSVKKSFNDLVSAVKDDIK